MSTQEFEVVIDVILDATSFDAAAEQAPSIIGDIVADSDEIYVTVKNVETGEAHRYCVRPDGATRVKG